MIVIADKDTVQLRFQVGDRVECNCGSWAPGAIVKLFYTQSSFPAGKCAPYQIKLDGGDTKQTQRVINGDTSSERSQRIASRTAPIGHPGPARPKVRV